MGETGHNEVRIVADRGGSLQRPPDQDVVADQRHQHGVLDIVIERVAVADALQCQPCGEWKQFGQTRRRSAEQVLGLLRQKRTQRMRSQLWNCDHFGTRSSRSQVID